MTRKEWTIIGVLGAAVVVIFLCLGCLVLGALARPSALPSPVVEEIATTPISEQPTRSVAKPTNTLPPTRTPRPTDTSRPTNTPQPTLTPALPTPTLTSDGVLTREAQNKFRDKLKQAKLTKIGASTVANVDYDLGPQWDAKSAVANALLDFYDFAPKLFTTLNSIDSLELRSFGTFNDRYGNEYNEMAFKFIITRDLARKIKWDNIDFRKTGSILTVEGKGNGVYIHPALKQAWDDYTSGK